MAIQGTDRAETLFGSDAAEMIAGKGGNDVIFGYLADDRLYGGTGNDRVDGGAGCNHIWGGAGNDTLIGGIDYAVMDGGAGNDLVVGGENFSSVKGGAGNDTLLLCHGVAFGGTGSDVISVGEWDDSGWVAFGNGDLPIFADEDIGGPTYIYGGRGGNDNGRGVDTVNMAFRLGEDAMTVNWYDYTSADRLNLAIYAEDGTPIAGDEVTKDWLDTDNNGVLNDADGDGGVFDVSYDAGFDTLSLRVHNDVIELQNWRQGNPNIDFLLI